MKSEKLVAAINDQIQAEFYSAYLYLAMSLYCETQNYRGFAHWLKKQYEEETGHALKLIAHLNERGAATVLKKIEAPPAAFGTPAELFAEVLKHEQYVTERIHDLYALAQKEKDYATEIMLQWFVNEQVEEEAAAAEVLAMLKMAGENKSALLFINGELGKR
jgi:ferritin